MQTTTALATIVLAACAGCEGAYRSGTPALQADETAGPLGILTIEKIDPAGRPDDWFEVINASDQPVVLADFVFVDKVGDLERARAFPEDVLLPPGASYVQQCSEVRTGFSLGSDEGLWIYRAADGVVSDGVDWDEGDFAGHRTLRRGRGQVAAAAPDA